MAKLQKGGENSLHIASIHGHAAIVDLLLQAGADIDSKMFNEVLKS